MPWIVVDWNNTKFYGPFYNQDIANNFKNAMGNATHLSVHQLEYKPGI